jgi:hypothetical protein
MDNLTSYAHCYATASVKLMDAIANPTQAAFEVALKWAVRAKASSYQVKGLGSRLGDEFDLANRLTEAVFAAALYNGYRI